MIKCVLSTNEDVVHVTEHNAKRCNYAIHAILALDTLLFPSRVGDSMAQGALREARCALKSFLEKK